MLYSYEWPGNVRELRNAIEFAANMTENFLIDVDNLPRHIQSITKGKVSQIKNLENYIEETEIVVIKKALGRFGETVEGKKRCAEVLGISLATLYNKISKYNI